MSSKAETGPEHIPTLAEVLEVVGRMVRGECRETKRIEDEEGNLRRLDLVTEGREEGESTHVYYKNTNGAVIYTMYIKDGDEDEWGPQGPQANLVSNEWVFKGLTN